MGELVQAENSFQSTIRLNPKESKAYLQIGRLHLQRQEVELAEQALRTATHLAPSSPDIADAQLDLATVLEDKGHLRGAEEAFVAAVSASPSNGAGHSGLGRVSRRVGNS